MSASETFTRWRYRLIPDHLVGEILTKTWIDTAIPFLILGIVVAYFGLAMPEFLSMNAVSGVARVFGEDMFIAVGMTFVMLGGGIDLSVGSNFALCNFAALTLINYQQLPLAVAIPIVMLVGGAVGLVNGVLIGFLRLRAFLTTLVTLIIFRAISDVLVLAYAMTVGPAFNPSDTWDFLGLGSVFGVPSSVVFVAIACVVAHVVLTRMRFGWHVLAVGGSRRSAYNAGIRVRGTVCATYVISGMLVGVASVFYAARLSSAGSEVGMGMEITILTAVVLGGVSLGGGRGSIFKAVLGTIIVVLVQNSLIRMGLSSGHSSLVLGSILLLAVAIDVRWVKNRHKVLARAYVSPTYYRLGQLPETAAGSGSPYAMNDRLRGAEAIGLGELDGPEDVIFDRDDNLYCGNRGGDIVRFMAPDYKRREVFAHIGGHPLGLAMDAGCNLHVCIGGMGVFKITPQREVIKLTDETNRTVLSIIDDSRLRLPDDLDIAYDGRVFFSEATKRYELWDWMVDALESRPNGRIICYNPNDGTTRTEVYKVILPNGICMEENRQSFLWSSTWGCSIHRYWF
ncbi:MAG: ABC transporter permease, partial [Roseiarcus sp.]